MKCAPGQEKSGQKGMKKLDPILEIVDLTHTYSQGTPFEHVAVYNINLKVYKGEYLAIIGRTGSGKSTLIQHLNGLISPTQGKILLNGQDINESKETLRQTRFKVGLVFQYPEYQLFEETVYDDVAFGPKNMGLDKEEIDRRVSESLEIVGLGQEYYKASPFDLSGGQKRRAAIAGVMAMEPEVLILDEPTAGLDPEGCREIVENIRNYRERTGATIITVTHDMAEAASNADRLCVMGNGKIALLGTPEEVFARADEIEELGLDLPEVTKIMILLKKKGLDVPTEVYKIDDAVSALLKLKGGRNGA